MKSSPLGLWHSWGLTPNVKQGLIVGCFALLSAIVGSFIGTSLRPSTGRYQIMNVSGPNYDIFDTASGKLYQWRGADGVKDIDDPIHNKIINVVHRRHQEYLPDSK